MNVEGLASQIAWKLKPQESIKLEGFTVLEGKYLSTLESSRQRLIAFVRVKVPESANDPQLDYSAALKTTLQQQRMKGLFEGLHRASVPFLYAMLMNQADVEGSGQPLFEFDLAVGTWVDGKQKDAEQLEEKLEQRVNIVMATLAVALPTANAARLEKGELIGFMKSILLPGQGAFSQVGSASTVGSLTSFEERSPSAGASTRVPDFYVPNIGESGRNGILLGSIKSVGGEFHEFRLQMDDLRRHVSVLGMTGSGKSTTAAKIVRQVAEAGLPVLILDWHNEYGRVVAASGGRVVAPGKDSFTLNPLEIGSSVDPVEHMAMVSDIFSDIYHFTHPQAYMFRNALQKRMGESISDESPTLSSLVKTIEAYPLRSAYDNETKVALLRRLVPLTQGQAGRALGGEAAVPVEGVIGSTLCVELGHLRDIQSRAIFAEVLLKMVHEEKVRRKGSLDHLTVVEEARNLAPARRPEDPPSVGERMISELRKFGESMMFVAQFPSQIAAELVKNSGVKIVHRLSWPDDVSLIGQSLGLSVNQKEHLTKLAVGEAIVGMTRLQQPILVQVMADQAPSGDMRDLNSGADP